MPKYLISWTEEDWYEVVIEADSKKKALDIWHDQAYDMENIVHTGTELQDSVEIEEI